MTKSHYSELVFDVADAEGGYVVECLSESMVTEGDTVEAYFRDDPKPQAIRLHLVRDEVFQMQ